MTIIGAAYLRCSDPSQDKSIDQQRQEIARRAAADGVAIPPENWFIDEGISGRSTRKRNSYRRLIERGEAQKEDMRMRRLPSQQPIDRLYVWAFSRIARNMFDCDYVPYCTSCARSESTFELSRSLRCCCPR
jgi:DNA invertase Pin-like site-specific DNA recombinase